MSLRSCLDKETEITHNASARHRTPQRHSTSGLANIARSCVRRTRRTIAARCHLTGLLFHDTAKPDSTYPLALEGEMTCHDQKPGQADHRPSAPTPRNGEAARLEWRSEALSLGVPRGCGMPFLCSSPELLATSVQLQMAPASPWRSVRLPLQPLTPNRTLQGRILSRSPTIESNKSDDSD